MTLIAALVAEGVAWVLFAGELAWGFYVVLAAVGAALVGLFLGAWFSRSVTRRLGCALEVSRAWMRGNLSLRIAGPVADDVGMS